MSAESLLLVLFLIVVPLLERLVRAWRARTPQPLDEPRVSSPEVMPPTVLPQVSMPPALPSRHPVAERLSVDERARVRRQATAAAPTRVRRVPTRQSHSWRLEPAEVRTAMRWMTILGPCRALEAEAAVMRGR